MSRHAVVATKAMTQSFSHILKIVYFGAVVAAAGSGVDPWVAAMMVLLAFAGTSLSKKILEQMNDESFRFWTRWTVMITGLFYLGSGVVLLLR
jgi:hypothetical protein